MTRGLLVWLILCGTVAAEVPATLPNTQPLTWDDDLADRMMDGLHRFVERKIEHAVANRQQFWKRDTSSPEAYEKSIAPNRERLKKLIGLVDQRVPGQMEVVSVLNEGDGQVGTVQSQRARKNKDAAVTVFRVRWPVMDGVTAEGLLLRPGDGKWVEIKGTQFLRRYEAPVVGAVVAIPDADQTPEQIAGVAEGKESDPPATNFAQHLAENGFLVLVPTLISRSDRHSGSGLVAFTNQPHREWIWRQAFHMGRHIIGLEVQKVLAGAEWLRSQLEPNQKVAVAGYGEGGLLALMSAAVEPRIDACLTSGYFEPHARPWDEPIYRHVWSLHREFGDAELATLVAPRPLVVHDASFPKVDGPPAAKPGRRGGAAIGKLETPDTKSVTDEFQRIASLLPEGFQQRALVIDKKSRSADDEPPHGATEAALEKLSGFMGAKYVFEPHEGGQFLASSGIIHEYDLAERQRRQVLELERFIQRLVRESDHTRDKFFSVTALAQQAKAEAAKDPMNRVTTSAKFSESTARFREYFRDEVLGKFDDPLLPFNARSRKIYDKEKWVGYDVVLDVFPDVFAWGVLLLPKDLKPGEKRPVVVCQHGRNGVPKVVIENDEKAYHDYAAKLAERGFIVFAPHNPYRGEDKYRFLSRKANCVKASLFSFILAQHEQILNWLSSLPQVDPDRIAFYGLSYGGETAVRIPPLLDRYCLSICSADFNDWARKVCSTDAKYSFMFTVEWEMPYFDMGSTFNYAEMVALLAPRPFMVERGHWDGVAPDEWVAYEYAKVRRLYDTLGLGDRTDIEFFDGLHEINSKGTFEFLYKHLKWPKP